MSGHRGLLGTGRDCRYSGAREGIGGIREHWGLLGDVEGGVELLEGIRGCRGVRGVLGDSRDCRY